jgi:hypothetical protein
MIAFYQELAMVSGMDVSSADTVFRKLPIDV